MEDGETVKERTYARSSSTQSVRKRRGGAPTHGRRRRKKGGGGEKGGKGVDARQDGFVAVAGGECVRSRGGGAYAKNAYARGKGGKQRWLCFAHSVSACAGYKTRVPPSAPLQTLIEQARGKEEVEDREVDSSSSRPR